ncbi:putative endo beta- protein [Botrytis fragariae]|uniref:Putative endo beta- protein n=1 Tax=Botrytis fragariae TaxID=1964551 RepID=A0A8H6AP41_9HELO|nr:putative endo beta- protein [Botrytis fragariae]KAF5871044.1 putative endo beta- protein [Botrytis fragariae]
MKCNAVILASFALGQSVMATNVYRPGGHYQVRAFNESEPIFPSGTGASSGFARPTGKPSHTKSKKPCKTKSSSAVASSVAATSAAVTSSEASVVTSAPALSSDLATPSTALYTTTITNHLSETVVVTVTPKPATSIPEASASASTTAVVVPTTLKSADVDTSSTFVAPSSSKTSVNSLPPYPTTLSTGTSSTIASTGFASGTGGVAYPTGSTIAAYYQCGGIGYTGSTTCVEGTHCQVQNPYYSQCIYQS